MTSPLSAASSALSILIDPSSTTTTLPGVVPLPFCRLASHLPRPAHLTPGSVGTSTVDAVLFAGGAFVGAFGGAGAPVADSSAFYSPPHVDSAVDGWHHPVSAAAAAAAVGLAAGGWGTFDPRPMAAAAGYTYGSSVSYGLDVRRKNATRESTSTLKAWLFDHIKNPYPTKGEKIMLAIITKMTLTQVSTWFANARRRLKKENKMQWPPRQRPNDDDDDDDDRNSLSDDNDDVIDGEKSDVTPERPEVGDRLDGSPAKSDEDDDVIVDTDFEETEDNRSFPSNSPTGGNHPSGSSASSGGQHLTPRVEHSALSPSADSVVGSPGGCSQPVVNPSLTSPPPSTATATIAPSEKRDTDEVKVKPRIWSLVDTATSGITTTQPEVVRRYGDAFPVGGIGGCGGFRPWMTNVIRSSVNAFSHSVVHPGLYCRPAATGSQDTCVLTVPRGATLYCGLNGGQFKVHTDRKRHLDSTTTPPNQSIDV